VVQSVVAISKNDQRLLGQMAQRQAITNQEDTIYSVKRLVGRKFTDVIVKHDIDCLLYEITGTPNGDCQVVMGGKKYSPQEISAMMLRKLKAAAEDAKMLEGNRAPCLLPKIIERLQSAQIC